ncbi:hypothetical protein RLEG3_06530 (plasmid) [Rhizobium leguminosarum bv. trifolii WSM1689]|uniref:hypothetical protein n=1 Tax=Rhizobium leguminosarum TaxID=384 RepID=UPI0003E0BFA5|nr:hypothetical protein [Rhizobium leguminosarum]AHF87919.1 hypothetical protein RLEG3_06530 [Rhizobium leguminosarum bv. trifolii WSM1689]
MSATSSTLLKTIPIFPRDDVIAVLREDLLRAVRRRYRRKGLPLPKDDADIVLLTIEIDSLTVVEILAGLDDVLPFKVTECVVKAGGYKSIAGALDHLASRIEKKWDKFQGLSK